MQVRQHVEHKRTFFYLEQLILKHNAAAYCLNIKDIHEVCRLPPPPPSLELASKLYCLILGSPSLNRLPKHLSTLLWLGRTVQYLSRPQGKHWPMVQCCPAGPSWTSLLYSDIVIQPLPFTPHVKLEFMACWTS